MNKATLALLISGMMMAPTSMAMAPNTDLVLMPYPQSVTLQEGKVALDQNFSIFIKGYDSPEWLLMRSALWRGSIAKPVCLC